MSQSVKDRMKKLRDLHQKRQEARQLNHAEVIEEDRRKQEPTILIVKNLKELVKLRT